MKARKVNPRVYAEDFEVLYYGAMGQCTKAIAESTSLTPHQIAYRLHKDGIRRMDFRNGQTVVAKRMLRMGRQVYSHTLWPALRKKYTV